jgi:hypothetical protein
MSLCIIPPAAKQWLGVLLRHAARPVMIERWRVDLRTEYARMVSRFNERRVL